MRRTIMETSLNIFDYAKKELTLDAIVTWLLNCAKSKNKEYQKAGKTFAKLLLGEKVNDDVEVFYVEQQRNRIDVYAEVIIGNKVHSIIIEDKVDSNLREDQLVDYYGKINNQISGDSWIENIRKEKKNDKLIKGDIYCVIIKKGYTDKLFLKELDKQVQQMKNKEKIQLFYLYKGDNNLENKKYNCHAIIDCFNKIRLNDKIWLDYKKHLRSELKKYTNVGENLNEIIKNHDSNLIHELIWDELGIAYTGMGHSGGLIHTYAKKEKENNIDYNLRLEKYYRKKLQEGGVFVLAFEYYDNNKKGERWTNEKQINKRIETVNDNLPEFINKFLYSKKDSIISENISNKFLLIKLQKEVDGKMETIDLKKLKRFIRQTWK